MWAIFPALRAGILIAGLVVLCSSIDPDFLPGRWSCTGKGVPAAKRFCLGWALMSPLEGPCGIKADGMAMRMMALRNVMGVSTHQYHPEKTINTLRATAQGLIPFEIKEPDKLKTPEVFLWRIKTYAYNQS